MSYTSTNAIPISNGQNNITNYLGNTNNDVFTNSTLIDTVTNSAIILGGGSRGSNPGKNGLYNTGTISTLTNAGAFLGGGVGLNGSGGSLFTSSLSYNNLILTFNFKLNQFFIINNVFINK